VEINPKYDDVRAEIRGIIEEVARKRTTICYADLVVKIKTMEFDLRYEGDRGRLGRILGEINLEEAEYGRSLLSSVVVKKDTNMPSPPYWGFAKGRLGFEFADTGEGRWRFYFEQLERVWDEWPKPVIVRA